MSGGAIGNPVSGSKPAGILFVRGGTGTFATGFFKYKKFNSSFFINLHFLPEN